MFPSTIVEGFRSGLFRGGVAVLSGAGVSVASGIPDFRSPGGLYDTLRPELLTATVPERNMMRHSATAVVDYELFRVNQFPYLEVRRPFILGALERRWKPTLTHFFFRLMHDKGYLRRIYSQNIDGLDLDTGLPSDALVQVHGSIRTMSCESCKAPYDTTQFKTELETKIRNIYDPADTSAPKQSQHICCKQCGSPQVKPDTVLFGRNLPASFYDAKDMDFPDNVRLLIVCGTSLQVAPASGIVQLTGRRSMRLVVNREAVGHELIRMDGTSSSQDVFVEADCDEAFLSLAVQLGWEAELAEKYLHLMAPLSQQRLMKQLKAMG